MSSIDIEVQKLKDASEKVKYRLENLSPKQKKILCNLFIDRIEMRRTKEGKKWKVSAEIFFRFNPQKFFGGEGEDRTAEPKKKTNEEASLGKKVEGGVTGRT